MSEEEKIPETLDEAIKMMIDQCSEEELEEIKSKSEDSFGANIHMSGGMNIRNSWNLWWYPNHGFKGWPKEEPPLCRYFTSIGITHGDDRSGIIMTSFHRTILGQDLDIPGQVKVYHDHWKKYGHEGGIPYISRKDD